MKTVLQRSWVLVLALLLTACNFPKAHAPTLTPFRAAAGTTPTEDASAPCAFVEGRKALPELSDQFLASLKQAGLPVETARAEAYGENCIAADNSVVRFASRETDLYASLKVASLDDEGPLGGYLEKILDIIDKIPPEQKGPNPGYIGVEFKAGDQVQNLWFTQTLATNLRSQGLTGADLYRALRDQP